MIDSTVQQFPSTYSLIIPDTGPTSGRRHRADGPRTAAARDFSTRLITGARWHPGTRWCDPDYRTAQFSDRKSALCRSCESSGVLTSYIVGFDQYKQAAGTYSIYLRNLRPQQRRPEFRHGGGLHGVRRRHRSGFNGLTGGRTTLPASFINAAGPNNGYLLAYAENSVSQPSGSHQVPVLQSGWNCELKLCPGNQGFLRFAPDLLAYGQHTAGDTTVHRIKSRSKPGTAQRRKPTSLLFAQLGAVGPCSPRGTRQSPLTEVPVPTTRSFRLSRLATLTPVDQYFTYQIADGQAQNVKVQIHPLTGVLGTGTMVFLGYRG